MLQKLTEDQDPDLEKCSTYTPACKIIQVMPVKGDVIFTTIQDQIRYGHLKWKLRKINGCGNPFTE